MSTFRKRLVLLAAVAAVAASGFFIARAFAPAVQGALALPNMAPPDPTSRGRGTPPQPYVGELNGFTFYHPDTSVDEGIAIQRMASPKCGKDPENSAKRQPLTAAKGTPVDTEFGYLPPGSQVEESFAASCMDDIVSAVVAYSGSFGSRFEISHIRGPAFVPSYHSREQIEPATVGTRPAVIAHRPGPGGGMTMVYMRDARTHMYLTCDRLSQAECLKIAEAVR